MRGICELSRHILFRPIYECKKAPTAFTAPVKTGNGQKPPAEYKSEKKHMEMAVSLPRDTLRAAKAHPGQDKTGAAEIAAPVWAMSSFFAQSQIRVAK